MKKFTIQDATTLRRFSYQGGASFLPAPLVQQAGLRGAERSYCEDRLTNIFIFTKIPKDIWYIISETTGLTLVESYYFGGYITKD